MTVQCEHSTMCESRGICTHSLEHEPFVPWKNGFGKLCTERYFCEFHKSYVKCKEIIK